MQQKKMEFKRRVLEEAIKKHQSVIDDFREAISNLEVTDTMLEGGQDSGGQSKIAESLYTEVKPLAGQLRFAMEEMKLLNRMILEQKKSDRVELGSIVVTDKETFFVSASIERFEVDGQPLFGLSTKAPMYKAMNSLVKGDTFTYGGVKYSIREIF